MDHFLRAAAIALSLCLFASFAFGQGQTSKISGTVVDQSAKSIPGATVTVTSAISDYSREVKTTDDGTFVIPDLVAGTYNLKATAGGFKTFRQDGIELGASDAVSVHTITLQIGDVTSSVSVAADTVHIQTESSDRVAKVSQDQIQDLPLTINHISGFLDVLKAVPGVANGAVDGGRVGTTMVTMNGIVSENTGAVGTTVNNPQGLATNMDAVGEITVAVNSYQAEYGQRAGGTVAITTKNGTKDFHGTLYYYGRNEKLNANSDNNNASDANPTGCAIGAVGCINHAGRSRYRFEEPGGTIGGPVLFPGIRFNKNRDKLFFFYSFDDLLQIQSVGVSKLLMPTTQQLMGNFSQTFNSGTTTQTPLYEPSNGGTPIQYPGNILPQSVNSLLNPGAVKNNGLAQILTMLPAPNAFPNQANDPTNTYNYLADVQAKTPTRQHIARIDYNINPKTLLYFVFTESYQANINGNPTSFSFPAYDFTNTTKALSPAATLVRTISPNITLDMTVGWHTSCECDYYDSTLTNWERNSPKVAIPASTYGGPSFSKINLPQFNPQLNPLNLIPNVTGLPAGENVGWDQRFPFYLRGTQETLTANVSWVHGRHNMKFGFYDETVQRNGQRESVFQGSYNVGSPAGAIQALMPNDTGIAIANALTGNFQSYQESTGHLTSYGRYKNIEWFAQDNWRVNRKLTLDIGARFYYVIPTYNGGEAIAQFTLAQYQANIATAPVLMYYACPNGGNFCGNAARPYNPLTKTFLANNAAYVGAFANNAAGVPGTVAGANANLGVGNTVVGTICPAGASDATGCHSANGVIMPNRFAIGPRIGYAYDVFGDGKMALRGGFGISYDQPGGGDDVILGQAAQPPIEFTPTYYYGQVDQLFGGQLNGIYAPSGTLGPFGAGGQDTHYALPSAYNWSFGVQRDLGKKVVLDVSYVGALGKHQREQQSVNALPYGTLRSTSSTNPTGYLACDPARSAAGATPVLAIGQTTSCTTLANQFLVPVVAYSNVNYVHYDQNSNYHSLQVQINRKVSRTFQLGGFWTWSKAMDYNGGTMPLFINQVGGAKEVYGEGGSDRTHVVTVNWIYLLPSSSHLIGKNLVSKIVDGFKVNGFGTFESGVPGTITYYQCITGNTCTSTSGAADFAACVNCSPISRVSLVGNLMATSSQIQTQASGSSTGQAFATQGPLNFAGFTPGTFSNYGIGNAGRDLFRQPGTEQVDLALVKDFRVDKKEAHQMEFRVDAFNSLNHTNTGTLNSQAGFSSSGVLINGYNNATHNGTFGTYALSTGIANGFNRIVLVSLRFRF